MKLCEILHKGQKREVVEVDEVLLIPRSLFRGVALKDLEAEVQLFLRDPWKYYEQLDENTKLQELQVTELQVTELQTQKEESSMSPIADINLNEVKEKPPLAQPGPYTFAFKSASLEQAKEPNKRTGQREWMVRAELVPMEAPTYIVFHNWSLSPGALESTKPTFSVKKFFETVGFRWSEDGRFDTNDMLTIRFVGTVRHEEWQGATQVRLDQVIKGA